MITYTPSKQRMENFLKVKESIPDLTMMGAVDSVNHYEHHKNIALSENLLTASYIEQNKNITGKLGCNLSHIYILQRFLHDDFPWLLVLEDDIALDAYDENLLLSLIANAETHGSHYIQLYSNPKFTKLQSYAEQVNKNLYKMISQWHTCAYLISKEGARRTLSHLPLDDNIDHIFGNLIYELNSLCWLNTMFQCKGALDGYDTRSEFGSIINDSHTKM
jgi:GR25 family glycosyltransferase involved in LPS biosynthesis